LTQHFLQNRAGYDIKEDDFKTGFKRWLSDAGTSSSVGSVVSDRKDGCTRTKRSLSLCSGQPPHVFELDNQGRYTNTKGSRVRYAIIIFTEIITLIFFMNSFIHKYLWKRGELFCFHRHDCIGFFVKNVVREMILYYVPFATCVVDDFFGSQRPHRSYSEDGSGHSIDLLNNTGMEGPPVL